MTDRYSFSSRSSCSSPRWWISSAVSEVDVEAYRRDAYASSPATRWHRPASASLRGTGNTSSRNTWHSRAMAGRTAVEIRSRTRPRHTSASAPLASAGGSCEASASSATPVASIASKLSIEPCTPRAVGTRPAAAPSRKPATQPSTNLGKAANLAR